MGFLEDKLYWSKDKADGTPRSLMAKILDPVGACIQPADLAPFSEEDTLTATVPSEPVHETEPPAKTTKVSTEEQS